VADSHSISTAILLAAGRGTRLGDLTATSPKPLLEIAGSPLISHIIDGLVDADVNHFVVVTGYLAEKVEDWAKAYAVQNPDVQIELVRQPELNGTGGAMLAVRDLVSSEARFIFGWGDILIDRKNYPRFLHTAQTDDFELLLAVNRVLDPYRGAAVYLQESMRVKKTDRKARARNLADALEQRGPLRVRRYNLRVPRGSGAVASRRTRVAGRDCANDR